MRSGIKLTIIFGCIMSFQNCSTPPAHHVGESYGGGVIIYVDGTGDHGLIAAPSDHSVQVSWGCEGTNLSGASGTAIGTGQQNSTDILNGCSASGIAAQICDSLVIGGYDDWFLPSQEELQLMYQQRNELGGFQITNYWSSTEMDNTYARGIAFDNFGSYMGITKNGNARVRAIRAF